MKSPGRVGIVFMLTVTLTSSSFISKAGDHQKPTPEVLITTPSNGTEGGSFQLTLDKGGSTGTESWSVISISGTAAIDGATLNLQQAGTVKLKVDVAEDGNYAAVSAYKLVTIHSPGSAEDPNMAQLWGTTVYGGAANAGVLFRMNADGTGYTLMNEFVTDPGGDGAFYNGTMLASDGNVYGTLSSGGLHNAGVLYRYNPTSEVYSVLYHFDRSTGMTPFSELYEAANGKLYGTTNTGGDNDVGVLFSFDKSNNTYAVVHNFDYLATGAFPLSAVRAGANGKLYGVTNAGGTSGGGVLYEYDPSGNVLTKKHDFDYVAGSYPYAAPKLASNGKLYGTTTNGGAGFSGTLFEYDPATNTFNTKVAFGSNFMYPAGGVTEQAPNGKMYIVVGNGGAYYQGAIAEYTPGASSTSIVYDFNNADLRIPYISTPIIADDGKLYGVRNTLDGNGIIYEYDPGADTYEILHEFPSGFAIPTLAEAPNGLFYGMADEQIYNASPGFFYSYDRSEDEFTIIKPMAYSIEGQNPQGSVARYEESLFLTTVTGGKNQAGTVVDFNLTNNKLTKRGDLLWSETGSSPKGFTLHSNGKLYGTTRSGGAPGGGTINMYDPQTHEFTKLYDFLAAGNEENLYGSENLKMPEGSNGLLYAIGSSDPNECIYTFDPETNEVEVIYRFGNQSDEGSNHYGLEIADGKLWGVAGSGGEFGPGLVFSLDLESLEFTAVYDFNEFIDGANPNAGLTLAKNGKLYGVALGGIDNRGVIFEIDPTDGKYTRKYAFTDGQVRQRNLVKGINGKLLGSAQFGGDFGRGYIFEFDPEQGTITIPTQLSDDVGHTISSDWVLVKRNNDITFDIEDKTFSNTPFTLEAITHGDVTYTALNDHITIDGNQATMVKPGMASIRAESSDDNFEDASSEASFCINPVKPTVTVAGNTLTSNADSGNQWYQDGDPVSGASAKSFTISEDGTYTVKVTVEGCTSDPSDAHVLEFTGLKDDILNRIRVYPNPTTRELLVDLPATASPVQLSLIDHLGRAIESRTAQPLTTEKFEVGHLPASLYIVRVSLEGKTISKVFVKR